MSNTNGQSVLSRIDMRLRALGLTDNAAGQRAGSRDLVRSIRRQITEGRQRGVSTQSLERLAPVLQTSAEWLLNASGPESADAADEHVDSHDVAASLPEPKRPRKIMLKGYVGAGAEAHYYALADEDFEEVEAPLSATDRTVALEIKGKSWGPLMDTWLVFYDDVRAPVTDDLIGHPCVVGLADDRILVKQIKRERDGSYTLLSNSADDPIKNAQIEWAARVTDMKPRN